MAKTSLKVKQQRPAKFKSRAYTRCERCGRPHLNQELILVAKDVDVLMEFYVNTNYAVFALEKWQIMDKFQA